MAPKVARGVAKGKAKAAPAPPAWARDSNARQAARRAALRDLNAVAQEVGVAALPVKTTGKPVQRLVKALQARVADGATADRARDAARRWQAAGGYLQGEVVPPAGLESSDLLEPTPIISHKILEAPFHLQSKAFMLTFNSRAFTPQTWIAFRAFVVATAGQLRASAWAACLEESLHSAAGAAPVYHTHAYFVWHNQEGVSMKGTDRLAFQGTRPRVDTCVVRNPVKFGVAAMHGLWYVHVVKEGTLSSDASYMPWQHYVPEARWMVSLWAARKLSHDQFEAMSAQFRTGHAARMQELAAVRRTERTMVVRSHVKGEQAALSSMPMGVFKSYPEVEQFVNCFKNPARRRPILVVTGPTRTGKSELAAHILRSVGAVLGTPSYLEVTVQDDGNFDASEFDVNCHAGILLDGVGNAQMLADHRETLQGRAKVDVGGKSSTMMYAYHFTLCRRAVVATLDNAAANLNLFHTHHWLSCPDNVMLLQLTEPAWQPAQS